MLCALVEEVVETGAHPIVVLKSEVLERKLLELGTEAEFRKRVQLGADLEFYRLERVEAHLDLSGKINVSEFSGISEQRLAWQNYSHLDLNVDQAKLEKLKWCCLNWPTPSLAQQAGLSTQAFEDFYFAVCLLDYQTMAEAVKPLKALMDRTNRVRITGPDTDLEFSIEGMNAWSCTGENNVPDGECYTAPIRDSVQGKIRFNTPSLYWGTAFDDVSLRFENGRVVESWSTNHKALTEILETDEGARFIGEFALAFNPLITKPMRDILFDEKIRGSLHLALGQSPHTTSNGNHSTIHWDLVLLQEAGGEVHFDERVIRRDGRFVVPELEALNPERLSPQSPLNQFHSNLIHDL